MLLTVGTAHLAVFVQADSRCRAADKERASGIVVSAAISLSDALQEIDEAYRATGGGPVRFNFAASNVLARQIVNGAPVDVFISADQAQMDYAQRRGAIDGSTRRDLLANRLVIVTPRGRSAHVSNPQSLLENRIRRIAIGDPAAVPVGTYARAYLERAGIWEALQPKLLPLANARAVLGAAESGGADAAIVYQSDAHASRTTETVFTFAERDGPPIDYPIAIVARSRNRLMAERFVAFLRGNEAREIFGRFSFRVFVITH
jgi:molybdate transport system substrate-binding protein